MIIEHFLNNDTIPEYNLQPKRITDGIPARWTECAEIMLKKVESKILVRAVV